MQLEPPQLSCLELVNTVNWNKLAEQSKSFQLKDFEL